ncbi:MAG: YdeI/OmpD-associated family protein [Sandaracinus sp.]|nr:YdeI/OmpD-associated family protein [Sandaracinus sp.]MCB9634218.1 YdeI/OmpD-associated family protein [Sandaracinus sp.]
MKTTAADYPRVEVRSRSELRAWLAEHHHRAVGAWVVTFKKGRGPHVSAREVCEEAICVGWVDSLPRKLDEDRTMLLVTPRRVGSRWSAVNKERATRLLAEGLVLEAGREVIARAQRDGAWTALDEVEALQLPEDLATRFASAPEARRFFDAFPRSAKRGILEWILTAKRPETRARRIEETVECAARNERANAWKRK